MVNEPVDRTEELIREALAHQATQAPHPASIQRNVRPRRHRLLIAGAAVAVAAAVAAGVLLPKLARHAQPNPAAPPSAPQFILLVGLDTRDGGTTMNADTIMLTRLAPDGSSWAASIPRDSFVDIPGQGKHKAGSAYPRAWQAARAAT